MADVGDDHQLAVVYGVGDAPGTAGVIGTVLLAAALLLGAAIVQPAKAQAPVAPGFVAGRAVG